MLCDLGGLGFLGNESRGNALDYVWGVCEGSYMIRTRLSLADCPIISDAVPVFILNLVGVKGVP